MYQFQHVALPFIEHRQVGPIQREVMSWFGKGRILPLVGLRGSGKTTLLRQLRDQRLPQQQDFCRRLACIPLVAEYQDSVRRTRAVSPITVISLSLLWHDLARILLPRYADAGAVTNAPPLFTEAQVLSTFPHFVDRLNRAQIGAVLIDGGRLLDNSALDWLLHLSQACTLPFSIVIAITRRADETAVELSKRLHSVVDQAPMPLELKLLDEEEFLRSYDGQKSVLAQLLRGLKAAFASELRPRALEVGQTIWGWTQGNWRAIHHVFGLFDEELGPEHQLPRLISQAVLERVEERLIGMKETWGDLVDPIPNLKKPASETVP